MKPCLVNYNSFAVFDAFEHWKAMIQLLCKCDESLSTRPMFFVKFFGRFSFVTFFVTF